MTLGEKFRAIRMQNNLSQNEMANILGINRNNLSRIETNKSEPNTSILKKLCMFGNIDVNALLDMSIERHKTDREKINYITETCESLSEKDLDFIIRIVTLMRDEYSKRNI